VITYPTVFPPLLRRSLGLGQVYPPGVKTAPEYRACQKTKDGGVVCSDGTVYPPN